MSLATTRRPWPRDHSARTLSRMLAITHVPSPNMEQCQRTYVAPVPIDHALALRQHEAYCEMLRQCRARVVTLDVNRDLPDCVFIEDTAILLDEVAVLASMGAPSRRAEPAFIEAELRSYRPVERVLAPATLEGGDVLRVGRTLLVGLSSRTNAAGAEALRAVAARFGYAVRAVPVRGCLHLKSACAALPDGRVLVNPEWLDVAALRGFELVRVPHGEPDAANAALVGGCVCLAAAHPRTADLVGRLGFAVRLIDLSEFAKAEGCVTCLSLLLAD
jgi:dimethylargininase